MLSTGEDLTHATLLQMVIKQASSKNLMLNTDILTALIRHSQEASRDIFALYLQTNMQIFTEEQLNLVGEIENLMKKSQ